MSSYLSSVCWLQCLTFTLNKDDLSDQGFSTMALKSSNGWIWQCLLRNCTLSHMQKVKEPNTPHLFLLRLPLHSFNCVPGPHQVHPGPYSPWVPKVSATLHHKHCSEQLSQLSMKKIMSWQKFANNVLKNLLVMQPHEPACWWLVLEP